MSHIWRSCAWALTPSSERTTNQARGTAASRSRKGRSRTSSKAITASKAGSMLERCFRSWLMGTSSTWSSVASCTRRAQVRRTTSCRVRGPT
eukprot:7353300-Prymnesium_polylepis.1